MRPLNQLDDGQISEGLTHGDESGSVLGQDLETCEMETGRERLNLESYESGFDAARLLQLTGHAVLQQLGSTSGAERPEGEDEEPHRPQNAENEDALETPTPRSGRGLLSGVDGRILRCFRTCAAEMRFPTRARGKPTQPGTVGGRAGVVGVGCQTRRND